MSLTIPPADPRANYLAHRAEIDAAIHEVLERGRYILGEQVAAFEDEFARYLGLAHAIGAGSGTEALHLALRTCGIGPDDPVFTVSHTAVATVAAIELCGARPVLVDIDPATYTIDPNCLEAAVKSVLRGIPGPRQKSGASLRRGAIIPVHLYGRPAAMCAIREIARRYDLWVIEDCAQSQGAEIDGQKAGSFGEIAATSFYPTKNLGALGDGGMLMTNDVDLGKKACLLREYGWEKRYVSEVPGFNTRLDELQAAILRVKLRALDVENGRRRMLAQEYDRLLAPSALVLPASTPGVTHVYHQYVVRTRQRDALQDYLREHGVGTLVHYPVPVHLQPAYLGRIAAPHPLTHTETAAAEILSLPMYPELGVEQAQTVAAQVLNFFSTGHAR